jgi:hypothetical protein
MDGVRSTWSGTGQSRWFAGQGRTEGHARVFSARTVWYGSRSCVEVWTEYSTEYVQYGTVLVRDCSSTGSG